MATLASAGRKLQGAFVFTADSPQHVEVAERLGMTKDAVKVAVYRLRQRYRNMLRAEVANTVASEEDIRDELDELLSALGS